MNVEQAIETQRLRLLRLVAGLFVALGVLSVGPVSRRFSVWVCGFVGSVLSRAESAAHCLVIAQARLILARRGFKVDARRFSDDLDHVFDAPETAVSAADCQARLRALKSVLSDLPRHARRMIRRIERPMRDITDAFRHLPRRDDRSIPLSAWRLSAMRVERPPDYS